MINLNNMTPKETAISLVEKYKPLVTTWDCYNDIPALDEDILRDAKACAIIAVDEILNIDWIIPENGNVNLTYNYWQEVKKQIKLL